MVSRQDKITLSKEHAHLRKSYEVGQRIIKEGEKGDTAFLIESGRVEITIRRGQHSVQVNTLGKEEIFGEMALLTEERRTASVTAIEPTVCVILNQAVLRSKVQASDPILRALLRVLAGRLRGMLDMVKNEDAAKLSRFDRG